MSAPAAGATRTCCLKATTFPAARRASKTSGGLSESQETVGVSPELFEEFVFQYQLPIISRFGFACYGCCEPVDSRWHVIKKIPNLRRVSDFALGERQEDGREPRRGLHLQPQTQPGIS